MDVEQIDERAKTINREDTVRQKAIRAHACLIGYFDGKDPTGVIKGVTNEVYAAYLAALTDSGLDGFEQRRYRNQHSLRRQIEETLVEAGFTDGQGNLQLPGRTDYDALPENSIGPVLPGIVAIIEIEYDIDSTEAVKEHRPNSLDTIQPQSPDEVGSTAEEPGIQDWVSEVRSVPGCDQDAVAYIYVLKLKRLDDDSTWFYVGKREDSFKGLVSRIRNHGNNFTQSRTLNHEGVEILRGDYNASMKRPGTTHQVVDIERIISIHSDEIADLDDSGAETAYIAELERKTSYEVALEHETTNVLGGK
jgi:hypothetical protein